MPGLARLRADALGADQGAPVILPPMAATACYITVVSAAAANLMVGAKAVEAACRQDFARVLQMVSPLPLQPA